MKKLNNLEKYVRVPDTQFFGTFFYKGEDIKLCDDTEVYRDDKGEVNITIHLVDKIKNGRFIKDKTVKAVENNIVEKKHSEADIKEGEMLIYVMNEGFVKTKSKLVTIDEAIKRYELLKNPEEE